MPRVLTEAVGWVSWEGALADRTPVLVEATAQVVPFVRLLSMTNGAVLTDLPT